MSGSFSFRKGFVDRVKFSDSMGKHWIFQCRMQSCTPNPYSEFPKGIGRLTTANVFHSLQNTMDHLYFGHCGKPYKCEECDMYYGSLDELNKHGAVIHPGSSNFQSDFGYPELSADDANLANWIFVNFVEKYCVPTDLTPPPFNVAEPCTPVTGRSPECQYPDKHPKHSQNMEASLTRRFMECLKIQKFAFMDMARGMSAKNYHFIQNNEHFSQTLDRMQSEVLAEWKAHMSTNDASDMESSAAPSCIHSSTQSESPATE